MGKETGKRLKNWFTTAIGVVMMVTGISMLVGVSLYSKEIPILTIVMVFALGWVFLFAKDTLIEGLFLSLFKIKKDE